MTTTAVSTSTPTPRVRMDQNRQTALVAGIFYLLTFASSIPAFFLLAPLLNNPEYIVSAGADKQIVWASLLDTINALTCVGTAVALYPVVRRQNQALALGFVTSRMFEAAVIMIGVVSLLAIVTLRQSVGGVGAANSTTLVTVGQSLVAVRDWTFLFGPNLMAAINALLLGTLMYRSRLVPRIIPTMGLVGAPLLLGYTIASMFGPTATWVGAAFLPVAAWEFSVGVWMIVKGFKPAPILATANPIPAGR